MKKIGLVLMCLALIAGGAYAAGNFVKDSGVVTYSNTSADLDSGHLVDLGDRYGVCLVDIDSNDVGAVATKGVFSLQRYDTNAIANGAAVYYSTASNVTGTAAADKYLGQCVEAVAVCTSLTNSAGEFVKFVKADINVPQRQCIVGTDVQAYNAALTTFAAAPKATTNLAVLLGDGTTGTLYIVGGIITNAP